MSATQTEELDWDIVVDVTGTLAVTRLVIVEEPLIIKSPLEKLTEA